MNVAFVEKVLRIPIRLKALYILGFCLVGGVSVSSQSFQVFVKSVYADPATEYPKAAHNVDPKLENALPSVDGELAIVPTPAPVLSHAIKVVPTATPVAKVKKERAPTSVSKKAPEAKVTQKAASIPATTPAQISETEGLSLFSESNPGGPDGPKFIAPVGSLILSQQEIVFYDDLKPVTVTGRVASGEPLHGLGGQFRDLNPRGTSITATPLAGVTLTPQKMQPGVTFRIWVSATNVSATVYSAILTVRYVAGPNPGL